MKKIIIAFALGILFCNISLAQDRKSFEFQVIKPKSVVKSTTVYLCGTGKKMFRASKDFWIAPFSTVRPALEVKKFKYTLPKIEWNRGLFQHIPAPPSDEDMKDYLMPIVIEYGKNPAKVSEF